jgi:hypothetical protein
MSPDPALSAGGGTPDAAAAATDALAPDIEKYRPCLANAGLTEAQQAEVLRRLWTMLSLFVDLSFGVDSVSLARPGLVGFAEPLGRAAPHDYEHHP